MISLSRVIKYSSTGMAEGKTISIRTYSQAMREPDEPVEKEVENSYILLENAKQEAGTILQKAKEEAEHLRAIAEKELQKLEDEREKVLQNAFEQGFAAGKAEGIEKGYKEAEEQIFLAKSIVEKARVEYEKYINQAEQTILSIALKAAEKILHNQLNQDREAFLPLVRDAVFEAKEYHDIHIYIHPSIYPHLVEQKDELFSPLTQEKQIYIYPSPDLPESGCIIETDGGRIDAGIDSQFQELKAKLFAIFTGGNNEGH